MSLLRRLQISTAALRPRPARRSVTAFTLAPDIAPVTGPGRVMVMGYLLCNVILLASYTANLAAYLSAESKPTYFVESLSDIGGPGAPVQYGEVCIQVIDSSIEAGPPLPARSAESSPGTHP